MSGPRGAWPVRPGPAVLAVLAAAADWAKAHRSVMRGDSPLAAAYADLDRTELALLAAVDALGRNAAGPDVTEVT